MIDNHRVTFEKALNGATNPSMANLFLQLKSYMSDYWRQPLSLRYLCVNTIRGSLGPRNIIKGAQQLKIPSSLICNLHLKWKKASQAAKKHGKAIPNSFSDHLHLHFDCRLKNIGPKLKWPNETQLSWHFSWFKIRNEFTGEEDRL